MGDDLYDNYGDNAQSYEPKYEYSEASGLVRLLREHCHGHMLFLSSPLNSLLRFSLLKHFPLC
eukprot:m.49585 g.49585  ORF g.49585 m.49585 type:complete len:63 (-) comp11504_c0_seq3:1541-1729(-)